MSLHNVVYIEDCIASVSETWHVFINVMNLTSNPQRIRGNTHLGTLVPVSLVYKDVPQHIDDPKPKTKDDKDLLDLFIKFMGK